MLTLINSGVANKVSAPQLTMKAYTFLHRVGRSRKQLSLSVKYPVKSDFSQIMQGITLFLESADMCKVLRKLGNKTKTYRNTYLNYYVTIKNVKSLNNKNYETN